MSLILAAALLGIAPDIPPPVGPSPPSPLAVAFFQAVIMAPLDCSALLDSAYPSLLPALQSAAFALDLAAPGHESWNAKRIAGEVRWCRTQWESVSKFPPLSDASRLPPPDVAFDFYKFCLAHRHCIQAWQACLLDNDFGFLDRRAAAVDDDLCKWQHLTNATDPAWRRRSRREALNCLRERWPAEYASGRWRPPLPFPR